MQTDCRHVAICVSQSVPMGEPNSLYLMKLKKCIEEESGSTHNRMEIPVFHSSRHLKSQS